MYACMKFAEDLTLSSNEVAAMVRKAANLLLTRSFSGCLSVVFRNPRVALPQLIQIIVDTQYLEKASPFLDEFVGHMTNTCNTVSGVTQTTSAMFHVARQDAEKQPFTRTIALSSPRLSAAGGNHTTLWTLERVVSLALLGVIPAAFLVPSQTLDALMAVSLVLHSHWYHLWS
ncbi:hypothetical protein GQX74_004782 [Glossina fuscipes]|nr:hypothetical protein GQX74_004782 [Glossina fuscipes]